jgi:hypothetical protein
MVDPAVFPAPVMDSLGSEIQRILPQPEHVHDTPYMDPVCMALQ